MNVVAIFNHVYFVLAAVEKREKEKEEGGEGKKNMQAFILYWQLCSRPVKEAWLEPARFEKSR